jgi:hypothetical protein
VVLTGSCGTSVVPLWYMCGTCPDRPEQVDKLLHDLGRSPHIARWQHYFAGTWWVPLSYQCGTHVALVWYKCCISMIQMWHSLGFLVGRPGQVFKLLTDLHRSLYCSFAICFLPPTHPSCWFGFATDAASCLVGFVSALLEVHRSHWVAELKQ